jgi:radical SAM superfamily enzyme YgiQ (UPF0313 family)
MHRFETGIYGRSLRYAPLTMPTLATLVPPELKATVRYTDEMVEPVDFGASADLVALTGITGTIQRAYEIADRFRARGATVVIGGVHASTLPDEAADHADTVVTGYAEERWPELLLDFAAGRLKPRYHDDRAPARIVRPDRRILRRAAYLQSGTVELTRGCGNRCEYCASRALFPHVVRRDPDDVLDEIAAMPDKMISFLDPNLANDVDYAQAFFERFRHLRKWWMGCATVDVVDHPGLLDAMVASGCKGLLIGFESVDQRALDGCGKTFNHVARYRDVVRALHRRGVLVQGTFVLGFDTDTRDVFQRTADAVRDLRIDYVHHTLYTPFPGTDAHRRLEAEGRITTRDWSRYTGRNVVFRPLGMTARELQDGFAALWRATTRPSATLHRISAAPWPWRPVVLLSNLHSGRFQRRAAAFDA